MAKSTNNPEPSTHKTNEKTMMIRGLSFMAAKMATNLMRAKAPQKMAVSSAPSTLVSWRSHSTAKGVRKIAMLYSAPTYRKKNNAMLTTTTTRLKVTLQENTRKFVNRSALIR